MADGPAGGKKPPKKYRNFPFHTLKDALRVARTISDQNAGNPMNKLLLADALGIAPSSSNFRDLLSSSYKYGLTEGTEKAAEISLTEDGRLATGTDDGAKQAALRRAVQAPPIFGRFLAEFDQAKLPTPDMLPKTLVAKFGVPQEHAAEAAEMLTENGRWVGLIRDLTGGPRVMLDAAPLPSLQQEGETAEEPGEEVVPEEPDGQQPAAEVEEAPPAGQAEAPPSPDGEARSRVLFVGHGKNHGPLEKIERFLTKYGIPYKVAEDEPNAGRPIPTKVADVMKECGAAILIFTKDEEFKDKDGNVVWRPSENVVYELGAASLLYDNRIVIFMEEGLQFPANFESVGRIVFAEDQIEAKTSELLAELIALKLIRITVS